MAPYTAEGPRPAQNLHRPPPAIPRVVPAIPLTATRKQQHKRQAASDQTPPTTATKADESDLSPLGLHSGSVPMTPESLSSQASKVASDVQAPATRLTEAAKGVEIPEATAGGIESSFSNPFVAN